MGSGGWLAPRSHAAAGGNAEVFVGEAKATAEQRGRSVPALLLLPRMPNPTPFAGAAAGDEHKTLSALQRGTCNKIDHNKAYSPACSYFKKMGENFCPKLKWYFIASAPSASFLRWFAEELLFCSIL